MASLTPPTLDGTDDLLLAPPGPAQNAAPVTPAVVSEEPIAPPAPPAPTTTQVVQKTEADPVVRADRSRAHTMPLRDMPDRISILLKHTGAVLFCFGRSDIKLNREINQLSYSLNDTNTPLTTEMDRDMNEWNRQTDIAKAARIRANFSEMDFDAILEGAVTLKRYALYLTTQACELMPLP